MVSATQPMANGQNTTMNGSFGHTRSSSSHFGLTSTRKSYRNSSDMQSSALDDATVAIQRRSAKELGSDSTGRVIATDYMALVEWIHNERLMALPKEGSSWDKVLVWAQALADRVNSFETTLSSFTSGSGRAANLAYGYSLMMLELGDENSEALETAFGLFNRSSLTLGALVERLELFDVSTEIRNTLALAYTDLISLISSIAIRYQKAVRGASTSRMSVDLYSTFGSTINSFRSRCTYVATEMWRYQIRQSGFEIEEGLEPGNLRDWLAPQDHILATIADDHKTLANYREEYTCLWAEPFITNFVRSDNRSLAITARPGAGKTVLAGAIFDRLQRPIAHKSYQTLFASINGRIAAQATSLSLVKSLLLQLLDQRIGNIQLYQKLVEAYKQSKQCTTIDAYENCLWKAFSTILGVTLAGAKDTVVLVDGLDEALGDSNAPQKLFGRLKEACDPFDNVRLITLSQPSAVPSNHANRLDAGLSELYDDVTAVARKQLSRYKSFSSQSSQDQDNLLHRIVKTSQGSFLWTKLFVKLLERQKTGDDFSKSIAEAEKSPKTIPELVLQHVQAQELSEECRTVLSFLTMSERPMTLTELRILLQTNTQKGIITGETVEVLRALQPVASLVFVADDLVYIRHDQIKRSLDDIFNSKKVPVPAKDRHVDFILRLLTYPRTTMEDTTEPGLTPLEAPHVRSLFEKQPLLEYVTRYWPAHFKKTTLYKPGGDPSTLPELKTVFPQTPNFASLERTCWESQLPLPMAIDWLILTTSVRRTTIGENTPATLQSTINTAIYYELIGDMTQSSTYYYISSKISRTTYNAQSPITTELISRYLQITQSLTTTSRTEVMTRREEMLITLIEVYKSQNSFGLVVETRRMLVSLYQQINEKSKAEELISIINKETGETKSTTTDTTTRHRGGSVDLKQRTRGEGLRTLDHSIFESTDKDEVIRGFDATSIDTLTRDAEAAAKRGDAMTAERNWVQAWYHVAEQARIHGTTEWHERLINTVMSYASFLRTQKRESEASSTLQGLWQEYETSQVTTSKSVVDRLTEVAKTMKTLGMSAVALSIFKYASSYYQKTGHSSWSSYSSIQQELQSTSREVMTSSSTTAVSDSVLREMFMHSLTTSSTTSQKIDQTGFQSATVLIQRYMDDQRWTDAVKLIKQVLRNIWPSFFATSLDSVTLTTQYVEECVDLTDKLAICYGQRRRQEKVEDVYVRLFRAVRTSRKIDDKLAKKASEQLIAFYKQRNQTDKLISVYQDLLGDYCQVYGETSKIAVDTMYLLGSLCRHHPSTRNYWVEYYFQIIAVLNKKSEVSHPDAMDAMDIVSNYFWNDKRYSDSLRVLRVMWNSLKTKPNDHKLFNEPSFVQTFFERYLRGLEETNVEFTSIHQTVTEYRQVVKQKFGATSQIYVQSTLTLAQICEKHEEYTSESITLYEELVKSNSTYVNTAEIRRTLSTLYSHQVRSTATTTTNSTAVYERAMPFYKDRITESRNKYGLAHEETLTQLREMAMLCFRQKKVDVAMQEVKSVMTEIATKETSSSRMVESANSLSQTFKDTQQTQRGVELVDEYHRQIVAKDSSNVSQSGFNLTSSSRQSLVFLAALEYRLRNDSSQSFSKIMADLTTESIYYEQWSQITKSTSSTEHLLVTATQLYTFLVERKRTTQATRIVTQVVTEFQKRETSVKTMNANSLKVFVITMLEYLSKHRTNNFTRSVSIAGNERVKTLIAERSYREACDVAQVVFHYVNGHGGYSSYMQHGFVLAMLISGRNQPAVTDQAVKKQMMTLSQTILREMLEVCKKSNIAMAQIQYTDLNAIIALMGEQQDYASLEGLLTNLWTTREVQKNWRPSLTLAVGRRLICARYLAGHRDEAIRLAEAIAYNLRRVHGPRHLATLDLQELVATLYVSTGLALQQEKQGGAEVAGNYFHKAVTVHETILRLLLERDMSNGYVSDHDHYSVGSAGPADGELSFHEDAVAPGELVKMHMRQLKLAVQRLGSWPREFADRDGLSRRAFETYGIELKGVEGMEKWELKGYGNGKAEASEDVFVQPKDWSILPHMEQVEEEL